MFDIGSDYDPMTPATGQLITELGLDAWAIREALNEDRARRCPDREVPTEES